MADQPPYACQQVYPIYSCIRYASSCIDSESSSLTISCRASCRLVLPHRVPQSRTEFIKKNKEKEKHDNPFTDLFFLGFFEFSFLPRLCFFSFSFFIFRFLSTFLFFLFLPFFPFLYFFLKRPMRLHVFHSTARSQTLTTQS